MAKRIGPLFAAAACMLYFAATTRASSDTSWPAILGSRDAYAPDVSAAIERVWIEPTLSRTIHGPSVHAPVELYMALVDAPQVTAAAARFRGIGHYEIRTLGDDRYVADDGDGARGLARILRREPRRRVLLSEGQQTSPLFGTVSGSALTILDLDSRKGEIDPRLTAYVYIDHRGAAALARMLVPTFGFVADRKLGEGLRVTSAVAEWAVDRSGGFCDWLAHQAVSPAQRDRVRRALPSCRASRLPTVPRSIESP